MYDQNGKCSCYRHKTKRRYHWHMVDIDGNVYPQAFGQTWLAWLIAKRDGIQIAYCFKVDSIADCVDCVGKHSEHEYD